MSVFRTVAVAIDHDVVDSRRVAVPGGVYILDLKSHPQVVNPFLEDCGRVSRPGRWLIETDPGSGLPSDRESWAAESVSVNLNTDPPRCINSIRP